MKLQELRGRLLNQQPEPLEMKEVISSIWRTGEDRAPAQSEEFRSTARTPKNHDTTEIVLTAVDGDYQPLAGVAKRLWVPDDFAKRIDELSAVLRSVEALGQSTADGLEPLKIFEAQMEQLAGTLQPVKAFCSMLEQLALKFELMGTVHEKMVGIMAQFTTQLLQCADLIEPAVALRLRAAELAKTLEPVDELAAQFTRLAGLFRIVPQRKGAPMRNGLARSL